VSTLTTRRVAGPPALDGRVAVAAFAAIVCAALVLQLRGLGGAFLGDDFSHVNAVYRAAARGELWTWTLSLFGRPLENASFAYRPLGFVSYALDWTLHGAHAGGWRVTSIALLGANAVLAGLLVAKWVPRAHARPAGVAAAACAFCYPFAGEIAYWINGRFDLLAALFSLLYLLSFGPASPATPRRHVLRLCALLAALTSKESAFPLPFIGAAVAFAFAWSDAPGPGRARIAARTTWREIAPTVVALAAYAAVRELIFGTAWKVYMRSALPGGPAQLAERLQALPYMVKANVGHLYVAWILTAAGVLAALAYGFARRAASPHVRALARVLAIAVVLYVVTPTLSIDLSSPDGEGARHLYLPWIYLSLLVGILCARAGWVLAPSLAWVALMALAQAHSLALWRTGGEEMQRVVAAVADFAPTIPRDAYALLLLPDREGSVWFARNAQGAIVMKPNQGEDYLDRVAVMAGDDFEDWSRHLTDGSVARFKGAASFDPARFLGLYCWVPELGRIAPLTPPTVWADAAGWRAMAQTYAPRVGCRASF